MVTPHGACLLTDGAVALGRILIDDKRKVVVADTAAVTMRGPADVGFQVGDAFCALVKRVGVRDAMVGLGDFAAQLRRELGTQAGAQAFEIMITAFVPGLGGQHRFFQSEPQIIGNTGRTLDPYEVLTPGVMFNQGAKLKDSDVAAGGFKPIPGETLSAWARRGGLGIMQWMREQPCEAIGMTGPPICGVGGHCDLTLITGAGLTTECIRKWPDVVGEAIDPTRKHEPMAGIEDAALNLNRAERRRMARGH